MKFKKVSDKDIIKDFLGLSEIDYKRNLYDIYDIFDKYVIRNDKNIRYTVIDFHRKSEEESWNLFVKTLRGNPKRLLVITGASGILHKNFISWLENPYIKPRIKSYTVINNGSYMLNLRTYDHDDPITGIIGVS